MNEPIAFVLAVIGALFLLLNLAALISVMLKNKKE